MFRFIIGSFTVCRFFSNRRMTRIHVLLCFEKILRYNYKKNTQWESRQAIIPKSIGIYWNLVVQAIRFLSTILRMKSYKISVRMMNKDVLINDECNKQIQFRGLASNSLLGRPLLLSMKLDASITVKNEQSRIFLVETWQTRWVMPNTNLFQVNLIE